MKLFTLIVIWIAVVLGIQFALQQIPPQERSAPPVASQPASR